MKPNTFRYVIVVAVAVAMAASLFASGVTTRQGADDRDVAKADYLLLESMKYKALDSLDACYDLLSRSYRLNPSDLFIGKEFGMMETVMAYPKDSSRLERGVGLMLRYIKANPDDYITGLGFLRLATKMGRTDEALDVARRLYYAAKDPTVIGSAYAGALYYAQNPDSIRKAIIIMDRQESLEGKSVSLTIDKMRGYIALGDSAAVFSEAHRLLDSSPQSIEFITFMGNVCMEFNRPDSAIVYFNKAVEVDPTSGYAYYSRAQYYNTIGDSVAYDREVFQALQHPDLDLEPKLGILREYVSQLYKDEKQRDRISSMFVSLVDQYPHEEDVRKIYGSYLFLINDLGGAAEQYDYLLGLNPDELETWGLLGQIYYNNADYAESESTMIDALKYFPDEVSLYMLASSAASAQKAFDRANAYIDRALGIVDSTDKAMMASLYGAKGDIAFNSNEPSDSVAAYYRTAFRYDPDNSVLLNNIAYYMACSETDLDTALTYVEKALMLEEQLDGKQSSTTLDTYAWVLFKRKDYSKALDIIKQVLELDEDGSSAELLEHAGDIYFMNGDPVEALDFWKQALTLDPENELLQRKVKHKTFFFK